MKLLNYFRRPIVVLRAKRTPDVQLNSALFAAQGPPLDALDELLSSAITDQWSQAAYFPADSKQSDAVAGARVLTEFKADLARRLQDAARERQRLKTKS